MSPILVTLTSRSDSDFERSNVSLKENKPDGINPNSNDIDCYVRKNEGKFYGFRQTEYGVNLFRMFLAVKTALPEVCADCLFKITRDT